MTILQPPSYMQNRSDHTAQEDRLVTSSLIQDDGVSRVSHLKVSAQASPNMSVVVAAGRAYVNGSVSNQGIYHVVVNSDEVVTISAADASLPRIDIIVLQISDSFYSGSNNQADLLCIAGSPNATPTVPTTPNNAIKLAEIAVAANVTQINSANITDKRTRATVGLDVRAIALASTDITNGQFIGEVIYNTTTGNLQIWDGTTWDVFQMVSDTGWVAIPALSGWTSTAYYRIKNNIVYLRGSITKNVGDIDGTDMATMPVAARPVNSVCTVFATSTGADGVRGWISSGGGMSASPPHTGGTNYVVLDGIAYILG